jgi:hypothetical protein
MSNLPTKREEKIDPKQSKQYERVGGSKEEENVPTIQQIDKIRPVPSNIYFQPILASTTEDKGNLPYNPNEDPTLEGIVKTVSGDRMKEFIGLLSEEEKMVMRRILDEPSGQGKSPYSESLDVFTHQIMLNIKQEYLNFPAREFQDDDDKEAAIISLKRRILELVPGSNSIAIYNNFSRARVIFRRDHAIETR